MYLKLTKFASTDSQMFKSNKTIESIFHLGNNRISHELKLTCKCDATVFGNYRILPSD